MAPPEVVDDADGTHSSCCISPRWNERAANITRTANMEDQDDVDQEQRLINEGVYCHSFSRNAGSDRIPEYKIWKKNSPFLYDMLLR